MTRTTRHLAVAVLVALIGAGVMVRAQQAQGLTAAQRAQRWDAEHELEQLAVVERKVMMPMRDGVRLATDIYRPKNATKAPTVFVRTPYNFNFWDIQNGVPADMTRRADGRQARLRVRRPERARPLLLRRELRHPRPADDRRLRRDRLDRRSSRGRTARSARPAAPRPPSTRWASPRLGAPGYAAMNVQGFGAGVGRVGPYYEQGNWYRGGAVQMLFIAWLYGEQNQVRPMFPPTTSREDLMRASKAFDLAQHLPPVDWSQALWHLPEQDIIKAVDGPRGIFADAMPVRDRRPDDPAHAERPGLVQGRALSRRHAAQRARTVVHVVVRRVGRPEPRALQPRPRRPRRRRWRTSSGRSSRRPCTARTRAPPRTPSSASAAWATRGSTTTRSSTASSTASSRARRARASTRCRRSPTTRWG